MKTVLSLLFFALAFCVAQEAFTANVVVHNRPGVSGILTGTFSYSAPLGSMRFNLTLGPVEYYNYNGRLKFLECNGNCETQTWTAAMPILYPQAGDTVTGNTFNGCAEHVKGGGAPRVFFNGNGQACRAVFADNSVYDFSNWGGAQGAAAFQPLDTCPKPLCTKRIDFELVFDDSGSIKPQGFAQAKNFAQSFAKAFTWGYDYVQMGLSMFSSGARLIIPLTASQATFIQQAAGIKQAGGSTCIGCGIQSGLNDINANGRTIPGTNTPVSRVFVVLTDGENNVGDYTIPLNAAKNQGIIFFAIGITGNIKRDQIENIGSSLPGIVTTFYGDDFSALPSILDGLVTATCVNIPGNPCGANCLGYCSCGSTCICPDVCNDGNACTNDQCVNGANGNGCYSTPRSCDDNNACTLDTCDPVTGCANTPINCDDSDVCTIDTCDPRSGCNNALITCKDQSPCTTDTCVSGTQGCTYTPIVNCPQVCNDPTKPIVCPYINCSRNECDPLKNGDCTKTERVCDDGNPCTIDRCDPKKDACTFTPKNCDDGNKCTTDYCDAAGICQNIPINATSFCNDFNACTNDICLPLTGCKNEKKNCSDGNVCTNDMCSTLTGCYYPPVDCWKQDPDLVAHPDLIGCFEAYCNATGNRGCMLTSINGSKIDACGVCNGDDTTCDASLDSGAAIGLGAGAIAGIVIGIVAVAAVLGVLGGKKGYDIWLKHRANMQGANTNPLYTHNGLSGNNPMYNADQAA